MEGGGGGDTSPVSNGQREQTTPVSPLPSDPVPSQGGDMTTFLLDRITLATRLMLGELDRQGLRGPTSSTAVVPASSEAVARLRETTVAETREEDECAVCWESYQEGDKIMVMPCEHGFHEVCIRRWLGISHLCPLCRFALEPQERAD